MASRTLHRLPLRLRLAFGYALFLVAIIAAVGLFLLATMESNLLHEADESLRLRSAHIERTIVGSGTELLHPTTVAAAISDLAPLEEFSDPGIYVQILDRQGAPIAFSPNLPGGQLPVASATVAGAREGREAFATVPAGRERVRVLARPLENSGQVMGVVVVGKSLHPLDLTLRRMQQLLAVAAASAVAASFVGGWWLTSRALGPISEVTRVARRIAATGRFEQRISPPLARDELGELAATFNEMLSRLEKGFRRQREFLADASHELRGPLTVIRGNLDLLKLDLPDGERQECAREAAEEVERMSRLISDLLFLAEVDSEEVMEHRPVALHEVVSEVWERAKGVDAGSHHLELARADVAMVLGDRDRLTQLLGNLVENALRYTPTGGQVTVSLRNHGQVAELLVSDTGIGIPAEQLPRIFERFYRVDKARSRGHGGAGLGLAIVKQIAEAHGGQVRVRSVPDQGTVFTVALPISQP